MPISANQHRIAMIGGGDGGEDVHNFTADIFVSWAPTVYGPWPAPVPVVFDGVSPDLGTE